MVTPSSGNVFADLGLPKPEMELLKAQLARRIREIVHRRRLTRVGASTVMGIGQAKVFALSDGRLTKFSNESLMRLLTKLGHTVEIVLSSRVPYRRASRTIPSSGTIFTSLQIGRLSVL
jgi:predicted XRE-type DNA-binding protein